MAEFCLNILLTFNIYYMMRLAFQGLLSAPNKPAISFSLDDGLKVIPQK